MSKHYRKYKGSETKINRIFDIFHCFACEYQSGSLSIVKSVHRREVNFNKVFLYVALDKMSAKWHKYKCKHNKLTCRWQLKKKERKKKLYTNSY